MMFIKEEREEMKIEEDFNHEDTETQTGLFHSQSSFFSHESLYCIYYMQLVTK